MGHAGKRFACGFNHRRKQKENQEDLLRNANENTLKALKASEAGGSGVAAGRKASALESYKSIDEVPSTRELAIQVCALRPGTYSTNQQGVGHWVEHDELHAATLGSQAEKGSRIAEEYSPEYTINWS